MFTASQIARARAATGARVGAEGAHDHSMRLVAAEAAAAAAVETARQAVVVAQAALRAETKREPEPARGSRSPVGRRRQSGIVVAAGAPRCCRLSTVTPEQGRHGRCSPNPTTTSGAC